MNVLVLNCGSSTVRFQFIATDLEAIQQGTDRRLGRGVIERLGGEAVITLQGGNELYRNSPQIRAQVCAGMEWMGLELDSELNKLQINGTEGQIHRQSSRLGAYVIPTDEELLIARDTVRCIQGHRMTDR
jgi:acetate kinase